jgi:hypothetical protein
MGVHYYNKSFASPRRQHGRLSPARVLTDAGIPLVVWGEDALDFAFFVPTCLFEFHILVPDELVGAAVKALLDGLSCRRMDAPPERCTEYRVTDISRPPCFPNSSWLETTSQTLVHEPATIVVHPQSYFAFDVRDVTCSATLSPPPSEEDAGIRFPTLPALFDSLVVTMLDPPLGYQHHQLTDILQSWVGSLFIYTPALRIERRTKKRRFEPRQEAVLNAVKEVRAIHPFHHCLCSYCPLKENRPYFMGCMSQNSKPLSWQDEVYQRREVLRKMG